jgi:hypothetical protein
MADTATVVNSGADLAAMAPADLFSGSTDTAVDTGGADTSTNSEGETFETPDALEGDTAGADATADESQESEAETEQPEAGTEQAQAGTQQAEQGTQEELPEGVVRGKDRNGKAGLFVEDARWKNIYGNHQLVQKVSEMLGEPATPEALQLRNDAYMAQERLFNDLTSGDPNAQGAVLEYFLDEMSRAREQGEVGVDPAVPMAQTFYLTLREKSPDAYATLRLSAARDLIGEMFEEASAKGDESLWLSAQHFARALANVGQDVTDISQVRSIAQRMGIPFYAKAEMQGLARGVDPVARLQAENARLHALVNGKSNTNQAAQFDQWFSGVAQTVRSAVLDDAVKPALASVESQWKDFPNDYSDLVVDRLHRKVTETIRADAGFNQRIKLLNDQAQRATSAQKRDELGQAIKQAYVNRAKLAVDAVKKPILEFAANRLKERADQNIARRQAAQNRTAPKGTTGTVPRSLTPNNLVQMKDGVFDPAIAVKQARQLLFGG